eukprot:Nk52_evm5s307 gene=Nk52_evmTU5s307
MGFVVNGKNREVSYKLQCPQFPQGNVGAVVFKAKAKQDIRITFHTRHSKADVYELNIGGYRNSKSVIRKYGVTQCEKSVKEDARVAVTKNKSEIFWVQYLNGEISYGRSAFGNVILSWRDPEPVAEGIYHVGFGCFNTIFLLEDVIMLPKAIEFSSTETSVGRLLGKYDAERFADLRLTCRGGEIICVHSIVLYLATGKAPCDITNDHDYGKDVFCDYEAGLVEKALSVLYGKKGALTVTSWELIALREVSDLMGFEYLSLLMGQLWEKFESFSCENVNWVPEVVTLDVFGKENVQVKIQRLTTRDEMAFEIVHDFFSRPNVLAASHPSIMYTINPVLCSFFDVCLVAQGGVEVLASKAILATHSDYFYALFNSGMSEAETARIFLTEWDENVIRAGLQYMLCGNRFIKESVVEALIDGSGLAKKSRRCLDLIIFADHFLLYEFRLDLCEYMGTCLDEESACWGLIVARSLGLAVLELSCLIFIAEHFNAVAFFDGILDLEAEHFISILCREELQVSDESDLHLVLLRWFDGYEDHQSNSLFMNDESLLNASYHSSMSEGDLMDERAKMFDMIIPHLRYGNMSVSYLQDYLKACRTEGERLLVEKALIDKDTATSPAVHKRWQVHNGELHDQWADNGSVSRVTTNVQRRPENSVTFDFLENGELAGICDWLGTQGGTKEFQNPIRSKLLNGICLNENNLFAIPSHIVEKHYEGCNYCLGERGFWGFDFGEQNRFLVKHFTIKHDNSKGDFLQTWLVEGSQDGQEWFGLCTGNSAGMFTRAREQRSFPVNYHHIQDQIAYRFVRIVMMSASSDGRWKFCCGGLEMYGHYVTSI